MATLRKSIINHNMLPDTTGECYTDNLSNQVTLGTSAWNGAVIVFKDPTADCGFYGGFKVPKAYAGTPKVVVTGILDGTPSTTSVDFEFSYRALADNEAADQGWQESVTFNTGNTNGWSDEDLVEVSGTCAANFAVDDWVYFYLKRDQGTDDFVGDFHLVDLEFEFSDT
jgi:hypothetical protein